MKSTTINRTKKLTLVAMFIALITVGAMFKIPIGPVPISFQFFFVVLAGLILGGNLGGLTVLLYVIMGLIGIPVFTAGGGINYVFQPTFGYMIGMIIGAFLGGHIAYMHGRTSFLKMLIGALVALLFVDGIGVVYMYLMLNYYVGSPITFVHALETGVVVFLPKDVGWCLIAALICPRIVPLLKVTNARVYSSFAAIITVIRLKGFGVKLLKKPEYEYVYGDNL